MCDMCEEISGRFLSCTERAFIQFGLARKMSIRAIGRELGRPASTISREIARNKRKRRTYDAEHAHARARRRRRRPQERKLLAHEQLGSYVQARLEEGWSPEQIAGRIRRAFPHDRRMRISHETIYQTLYVLARRRLRKDLEQVLRTGRVRRKPHGRVPRGGGSGIQDLVSITDRPAEVADRAVPGHWEGDLLCGPTRTRSQVGTLVERTTRYTMLVPLVDRSTSYVAAELATTMGRLPAELTRSLTWDRGLEMRAHRRFSQATGIEVYFCDPHAPWQRGTNENTNGLLRQYLPKGTDLSVHDADDLLAIERRLNDRPRKTLDWATPSEAMAALLSLNQAGVATTT